ncbi:MAG: 2-isopropylmalate synthase [Gallionellales bacterium 35-53-114]|jgi:2-isopropylmalate synthase|nr:MAG: 2-isopropylmalate synthase [Gallionellales bacterium 35-53-114]OYZ64647.1 MAG: 2-isopropylmalate synthase [Gallionellales bacterium 24-53-125]OZB07814.1 MAG: 2-isopropylmalate synthase [Gallionellales bacterium 39-52-133]HQS58471.1 2-isopropylmalate synthase [Gallionellaceae bacterium]HQS74812.1 2-isopropylmalate synthase [Gallionellaceae bacterium]
MKAFDHNKYKANPVTAMGNRQWPNRTITRAPIWASVDLRDGNQALLEPMNVAQKRRLWALLVKLGFKEIEVGFPSASKPDYDFVRWLIEEKQIPDDVNVQVLVQAREDLIVRTYEALKGIKRATVHFYNSTSTVQRERVFGMDREGITAIARKGAEWVKREAEKYPEVEWTFEYSPESFTNTEMDYAVEICEAVMDVMQPTPKNRLIINLPSTVESTTPNVFADQVEYFATHISRRDAIILSVHTHNDRGCAVAAAELAILAGADRVEGTLLGNGERTGNMDIVTMAMNLYSQGVDPELDIGNPDEIIQVVGECTSIALHPRHPWVGELVYTAFSGSHQDAIRKCLQKQQPDEHWQVAYLPIDPKDIGRDYQAVIRVNSQSGKGGVAFVLERDYGLSLPRWMQVELAQLVQKETEQRSGEIDSATIHAIFTQRFVTDKSPLALNGYKLERAEGQDLIQAKIVENGNESTLHGSGEGALSAFIDGWMTRSGQQVSVVDYNEHAIGTGTNAEAVAYVQLNINGQRVSGAAFDHDTVSASLKAVLSALNRSLVSAG